MRDADSTDDSARDDPDPIDDLDPTDDSACDALDPTDDPDPTDDRVPVPVLPDLTPGITLLAADDPEPLRALVVDHLLGTDGRAVWVDAGGVARTPPLCRLAPRPSFLDRIRLARGFTAAQHRALLDRLADVVTDRTALVVVPRIDRPYRAEAGPGERPRETLVDGIATLAAAVREHAVPALVTRRVADRTSLPVENAAHRRIDVASTPFGPRFVGEGVETLWYPDGDGVQTTLAFWRRALAGRHGIDPGIAPAAPGDDERGRAGGRAGPVPVATGSPRRTAGGPPGW